MGILILQMLSLAEFPQNLNGSNFEKEREVKLECYIQTLGSDIVAILKQCLIEQETKRLDFIVLKRLMMVYLDKESEKLLAKSFQPLKTQSTLNSNTSTQPPNPIKYLELRMF
jgi:hypothetical protein